MSRISVEEGFDLDGPPIEISVGTKETTQFFIHEKVLCTSAGFFQAALQGEWKESKQRSIKLPEVKKDTFKIYMYWLYTCNFKLLVRSETATREATTAETTATHEYAALFDCYLLGDRVSDPKFKNAVIDAIIDKTRALVNGRQYFPDSTHIKEVYSKSLKSSLVRKLLVDLYACEAIPEWLERSNNLLPMDFTIDLAIELVKRRKRFGKITNSRYHEPVMNK